LALKIKTIKEKRKEDKVLITELRDDKVKDDITVNERLQVIDEQLASMSAN